MESDGMLVDGSNYELSIKFGNFPYHAIWSLQKHKVEAVRHRRTLRFPSPRAWCEMTEPHGAGPCSYASTHENMLTQFNIPKLGCTSITGDVHYGSMTAEEAQRYPGQMALNTEEELFLPGPTASSTRSTIRALEYTKAVRARTDIPSLASIVILNQAGNDPRPFIEHLGFICSDGTNVADFLTDVTVPTERAIQQRFKKTFPRHADALQVDSAMMKEETKEKTKLFKQGVAGEKHKRLLASRPYRTSFTTQASTFIQALITSSLFYRIPNTSGGLSSKSSGFMVNTLVVYYGYIIQRSQLHNWPSLMPNGPGNTDLTHQSCARVSGATQGATTLTGDQYLSVLSYSHNHVWRNFESFTFKWHSSADGGSSLLIPCERPANITRAHCQDEEAQYPEETFVEKGIVNNEQLDVHESLFTVREALDRIENGVSVEQRKRVTIGVELVSKPSILILYVEPTSGLDGQSTFTMAVLVTIYLPSAQLFSQSDTLLLLAKGGKTVYFGDIGDIRNYFGRYGAPCLEGTPSTTDNSLKFAHSLWDQVRIVTHRISITLYHNVDYFNKLALHMFSALFNGFPFWIIGDSVGSIKMRLFTIFIFVVLSVLAQLQSPFINHQDVFETREKKFKYCIEGFPGDSSRAGATFFVMLIYDFVYTGICQFIAAYAPNAVLASMANLLLIRVSIYFCGVFVPYSQLRLSGSTGCTISTPSPISWEGCLSSPSGAPRSIVTTRKLRSSTCQTAQRVHASHQDVQEGGMNGSIPLESNSSSVRLLHIGYTSCYSSESLLNHGKPDRSALAGDSGLATG
ncbi:hypothetical protein LZ32DRAFT_645577 [Colletotrichum eremochloae]|nr:hypothetical protein LZ32DRAFT_645577 [Colletotrichum eremochloae]